MRTSAAAINPVIPDVAQARYALQLRAGTQEPRVRQLPLDTGLPLVCGMTVVLSDAACLAGGLTNP